MILQLGATATIYARSTTENAAPPLASIRHHDGDSDVKVLDPQPVDDLPLAAQRNDHQNKDDPAQHHGDAPHQTDCFELALLQVPSLLTVAAELPLERANVDADLAELEAKLELLELQRARTQQSCAEYLSELGRDLLSRQHSLPVPAVRYASAAREVQWRSSKRQTYSPRVSHQSSPPQHSGCTPPARSGSVSPFSYGEDYTSRSMPPSAMTACSSGSSIGVGSGNNTVGTNSVSHGLRRPRARGHASASGNATASSSHGAVTVPHTFSGPYRVASSRSTGSGCGDAYEGESIIMMPPGRRNRSLQHDDVNVSGHWVGAQAVSSAHGSAHNAMPACEDDRSLLGCVYSPPYSRVPVAAGSMRLSRSNAPLSGYHVPLPDRRCVSERKVSTAWSVQLSPVDSLPSCDSPFHLGGTGSGVSIEEGECRRDGDSITMDATPSSPPCFPAHSPSWKPGRSPSGINRHGSSNLSGMLRGATTSSHKFSSPYIPMQSHHSRSSSTPMVPSFSSLPPSSSLLPPVRHASMDVRSAMRGGGAHNSPSSSRLAPSTSHSSLPTSHPSPVGPSLSGRERGPTRRCLTGSTTVAYHTESSYGSMPFMHPSPSLSSSSHSSMLSADLGYYEPTRGPLLRSSSDARRQMGSSGGSRVPERSHRRRATAAVRGGRSASVSDLQFP